MKNLFWVAVLFFGFKGFAQSGDWPQWRGSNRDGLSTEKGLLQEWPAGGPKLAWRGAGLGEGYSSVAITRDQVFTTGEKGSDAFLVALNRADGKNLWSAKLGKSGAPGWGGYSGPRSTPATDGEVVIAVGQWGELAGFDAKSGKELWRKQMDIDFRGPLPEWGFAESPLLDGNIVLMTPGGPRGAIVALHKKTGALIWQSRDFKDPAHYSSLIAADFGGIKQYIQLTEQSVAGVAAKDGSLLWRAARRGATAVIPTPIFVDGFVYVTSGYAIGCNLFRIIHNSAKFSAEEVYANKVMANHHGGVIRLGDHVYGYSDGKGWTCQEWKSGRDVWQDKKLAKGAIAHADSRFYLRAESGPGTVALIEVTPAGYREKGRFNPPNRSDKDAWSHPVIAGGKLYLRDQDVLLCYDVRTN